MSQLKAELAELLAQALASVAPQHTDVEIHIERPKDNAHGDFATNLALQLARRLKQNPQQIARYLVAELPPSSLLSRVEVAGAGFVNFYLQPATSLEVVSRALKAGDRYGESQAGDGQKTLVEYVSANPTGPLHVGHGRGAAYGAALAKLLQFAGYEVTQEYYVNDAGRQMEVLILSTWLRYLQLFTRSKTSIPFPSNLYQGDYVREMAQQIKKTRGDACVRDASTLKALPTDNNEDRHDDEVKKAMLEARLDALIATTKQLLGETDWEYIHQHVLGEQLANCRSDLEDFGVHFDLWFSEKSLFDTGLVEHAIETLRKAGHIYEQDGAQWFRSSVFGDEKDRVVQRENGEYTYFASDIAYHLNKFERGFERIINVWGADHHGYIARINGAAQALGLDVSFLHVTLVQFAVLYRDGQKLSMSTRGGEFVTMRELCDEVGKDACRFFYASRKADQHLDFDLDLAKRQHNENPVYYVQYAHARIVSLLRHGLADTGVDAAIGGKALADEIAGVEPDALAQALGSPLALALANLLDDFPEIVAHAAQELSPHQIAFYVREVAAAFHAWYNAERVLTDDVTQTRARLAMAAATRQVIANACALLDVSCPDTM